jgi:hypothetical protein
VVKMRDNQRSAVYAWEDRMFGPPMRNNEPKLSLEECHALMLRAWERYTSNGSRVPTIKDGRGRRRPCYRYDDHSIRLPKHARRPSQVLHETAHAIVRRKLGETVASHGPEFMRLYMDLLERFAGASPGLMVMHLYQGKRKVRAAGAWNPDSKAALTGVLSSMPPVTRGVVEAVLGL